MLASLFVNLTQARVFWEEETSSEKMTLSEHPVGKIMGHASVSDMEDSSLLLAKPHLTKNKAGREKA